jgi:hypothetical protein
MEATCSSETSLDFLYSTQNYTPEVCTLQHKHKFYSERIIASHYKTWEKVLMLPPQNFAWTSNKMAFALYYARCPVIKEI